MDFFWSKKRTVKCQDGTERYVYRNIDDIFPIYLKEVKASAKAAASAANDLSGEAAAQYEDKISELLFHIDEYNKSSQTQLRSAYVIYEADPCAELPYLKQTVEALSAREYNLRRAEAAVKHVVSIANACRNGDTEVDAAAIQIGENLSRAIDLLSASPIGDALIENMSSAPEQARQWRSRRGN